jgi:hypothetical protein
MPGASSKTSERESGSPVSSPAASKGRSSWSGAPTPQSRRDTERSDGGNKGPSSRGVEVDQCAVVDFSTSTLRDLCAPTVQSPIRCWSTRDQLSIEAVPRPEGSPGITFGMTHPFETTVAGESMPDRFGVEQTLPDEPSRSSPCRPLDSATNTSTQRRLGSRSSSFVYVHLASGLGLRRRPASTPCHGFGPPRTGSPTAAGRSEVTSTI